MEKLFSYNHISVGDAVYSKTTPVYLYYRTYIGLKRNEIEYLKTTKKSLKKFLNINNFSQGKNINFMIFNHIYFFMVYILY